MNILLKNATIVDPRSKHHLSTKDIFIQNGIIDKIGKRIKPEKKHIVVKNITVTPGWVDVGTHLSDPGFEYRESSTQTLAAAAFGGFTDLICISDTDPVVDNGSMIKQIKQTAKDQPTQIHPIGTISKKGDGEDLAELVDMHHHGAVGFSNGVEKTVSPGLLKRALLYVKSFAGLVMFHPRDTSFSYKGMMHEGKMSIKLGMSGLASLGEKLLVSNAIEINDYAQSKLFVHLISSKSCISLVKNKSNIFSSVSFRHLECTDENLKSYNTHYKLLPPLRTDKDKKALVKAVQERSIDIICSNHKACSIDEKNIEFEYADYGALGLQTCGASMLEIYDITTLVEAMSIRPREIFNLPSAEIKVGTEATLTLVQEDSPWTYDEGKSLSSSKNDIDFGKEFKHNIKGVIHGKKHFIKTDK